MIDQPDALPAPKSANTLQDAAQAVLHRWDSPRWDWAKQGPTADLIAALRAAMASPLAPAVTPACPLCKQEPMFSLDRRVNEWSGTCRPCGIEGHPASTEAEARHKWVVWHHARAPQTTQWPVMTTTPTTESVEAVALATLGEPVATAHRVVEMIRAAGGVVHKDGNIFFTNVGMFNSACAALHTASAVAAAPTKISLLDYAIAVAHERERRAPECNRDHAGVVGWLEAAVTRAAPTQPELASTEGVATCKQQ